MALLSVENLTISFGGVIAVNNVSFSLENSEALGVIGPNGSGKTTLFNLLSGIYQPTAGKIIVDEHPTQGLAPNQVFDLGIARTFQNGRLFWNLNVVENIIMGLQETRDASVFGTIFAPAKEKHLKDVSIKKATEIMGIFGDLLTKQADKAAKDLPYADRRRLEICRAIASKPKVLLLDEPSAGMDVLETEKLMRDLLKVKTSLPNLSVIVVEHDMGFIKGLVNKVMVLNYGQNIAYGSFDEVANNEQVINAYLGQEDAQ